MEFSKSDSKRLLDGNIKIKHSAVLRKILPYLIALVLLGTTVFATIGKLQSKQAFLGCISKIIGMLSPKNAVVGKCGEDYCYYSCGLTKGCLLYTNNTPDWSHYEVDKTIFLEEENEECYNKINCDHFACIYGNTTIGNGCSYCVSRQWLKKLKC